MILATRIDSFSVKGWSRASEQSWSGKAGPGCWEKRRRFKSCMTPSTRNSDSVRKIIQRHVAQLLGGLRAKLTDIENKALRDWIVKEVKSAIPVRRRRKYNPIISRALQLRIHGKMWREILRDPEVLGPKPTEPRQRYMWETTARSIRKAAALRTSRSKRKVCKQQINRTIPWVQSDPD